MSKRRGSGEGAIFKRKDDRWVGTIDLGFQDGRRTRKSFYGRTRKEVADKLADARGQKLSGIPFPDERTTLQEYLEWWMAEIVPTTVRQSTAASYKDQLTRHIIPVLGNVRLARLTAAHVQSMLSKKLQSGLSPRTVQYQHAILRRALKKAERLGLVTRNVALLVDPPRIARGSEIKPLTLEESRALLNQARKNRLFGLYGVALALGLRRGEALGLKWSDIDLDSGTMKVCRALQRIDGALRFVEPKSARSRRTISMPPACIATLRAHRRRQLTERLKAGEHWQENDLVFASTIGTPLEPRNITRQFHELCEQAGIGARRFHDLRHTCATLLIAQNVNARVIMDLLGHSSISVTMDVYGHVIPTLQREASERVEALLGL